ncbi:O-antigen ligase family protein [Hyphomicrobium facile]|uniref:O-antigen ligase n=1 Tax=Hyphomicrobium facile TaxID=51670 RepID=A0A1I7NFH8_9HYPH|nr:O-antigen ligase family protein [Hyphomicrobium facile]SFV33422.1 O-antigen ligase [Hyphomicrobium facile]
MPGRANRVTASRRAIPATVASRIFASIPFVLLGWCLVIHSLADTIGSTETGLKGVPGVTVVGGGGGLPAADWQNRIFLLLLLLTTLSLAIVNRSRLNMRRLWSSPPIVALAAFMLFAVASITWAYSQEAAFNRVCLQIMVLLPLILPFAQVSPVTDTVRTAYLWYAFAIFANVIAVQIQAPALNADGSIFAYFGLFSFKQGLGQCASVAILLSFYELLFRGWRRCLPFIVIPASVYLIFASQSKGALAFALVAPVLAGLAIIVSSKLRISLLIVLAAIPAAFFAASMVANSDLTGRISYMFYGDSTLSNRTVIWDFVQGQYLQRPWFGWGFHSFWQVGPDAPSVAQAPYWVKHIIGSHSGYLDVKVETGRIGYTLFIIFILATLFALDRVRRRDPVRAWILLSLAFYVIITNLIETVWLGTNEALWLLFVLVVAETTRYPAAVSEPPFAKNRGSRARTSGYVGRRALPGGAAARIMSRKLIPGGAAGRGRPL